MNYDFVEIKDNKLRSAAISHYINRINEYKGHAGADDIIRIRKHVVKFFLRIEKVIEKWAS